MKRIAVVATALTLLLAGPATAKDKSGSFGIGYDTTLGGAGGLAMTYWATHALGIDATIGFVFINRNDSNKDAPLGVAFSIGARYNIAPATDVNLSFGVRVSMAFVNKAGNLDENDDPIDSIFQANIELPLTVEYFFSDHFSINLSTGLTMIISPETKGNPLTPTNIPGLPDHYEAKDFGLLFGNGGMFASAGFRFYFR